ncbi:MAG: Ldh family oxidoreductase, partial [Nitrososphaerota archaeon]
GESVPIGMILDKNGKPTTNPKDYINGGALLPFGEYKGYGLAIAIEILSSLLSGAPHTIHIADSPAAQGGLFIEAINIEAFRPYEEYIKDLEEIVNLIKSCPLLNGFNEILLPGELEYRTYKKRIEEGIPMHEDTWKEFKIVSEKLKIDLPKLQ